MFSAHIEGKGLDAIKALSRKWIDFGKEKPRLEVGIFPESTTTDGRYVAEYATYNEYGTAHIPARPFARNTIAAKSGEWNRIFAHYAKADPKDIMAAYEIVGEFASKDMMQTINEGNFAPNAPATIARKAARGKQNPNTPLIDTGTMQEAIKYKIATGGAE